MKIKLKRCGAEKHTSYPDSHSTTMDAGAQVRINVDLSTHRGPHHFALITRAHSDSFHSYSVTLVPADAMELRDELTAWLKTLPVCNATEPNPHGTQHRCWKPEGHRVDHECACAVRWSTPTPSSPTMNR